MDSETYTAVKRAIKTSSLEPLKKIRMDNIPLLEEQIGVLKSDIQWESLPKFERFLKVENSKSYRDELVFTFLLFTAKTMNRSKLHHIFVSPYSEMVYNWMLMYKYTVYSVVTLIYRKRWMDRELFFLDEMVLDTNQGRNDCLRLFLEKIKLIETGSTTLFDCEKYYKYNWFMGPEVYGPFYWQMLHLMAEAFHVREGEKFAKELWRQFTVYSMHRTLRCPVCKYHYESMLVKRKDELLKNQHYAKLWFDIHNEVNVMLKKEEYSESQFEEDRKIRKAMLQQ